MIVLLNLQGRLNGNNKILPMAKTTKTKLTTIRWGERPPKDTDLRLRTPSYAFVRRHKSGSLGTLVTPLPSLVFLQIFESRSPKI